MWQRACRSEQQSSIAVDWRGVPAASSSIMLLLLLLVARVKIIPSDDALVHDG